MIGVGGGGCIFIFIVGDNKFSGFLSVCGGSLLVKSGLFGMVYIEDGKIVLCKRKFFFDNGGIFLNLFLLIFLN